MSTRKGAQAAQRALTSKQELFCQEYLVDLNATQAAVRAGYSPRTAHVIGQENLTKPAIAAAIQERMNARSRRVQRSADDVLTDLHLVKVDAMKQVMDKDGNKSMINHAGALKALELEGRHLKMFTDKMEVSGDNGGAIKHTVAITYVNAKQR